MPPKKKPKTAVNEIVSEENPQDNFDSSQNTQKTRAKNYSVEESEALVKCCDKYFTIIKLNSNSDKQKQQKRAAWDAIKREFDTYLKSQGFYVSEIWASSECSFVIDFLDE